MKMLAFGLVFLLTYACEEEDEKSPPAPAAAAPAPGAPKAPASGPAAGAPKEGEKGGGAPAGGGSDSCPGGKWRYDYGEAFAKAFIESNIPNAKVTKNSGAYVCEFPKGPTGKATCSTAGGPVIHEITVNDPKMPMTVYVEMSGTSSMTVTLLPEGQMKITGGDLTAFHMKAKATLGGQEIPFPMEQFKPLFPEGESVLSYKCEGGNMKILMHAEGMKTDWQTLTAVP